MLTTVGSAIGLFAATNIDDIVVLTVLFRVADDGALVELDRAKVGAKARWVRFV